MKLQFETDYDSCKRELIHVILELDIGLLDEILIWDSRLSFAPRFFHHLFKGLENEGTMELLKDRIKAMYQDKVLDFFIYFRKWAFGWKIAALERLSIDSWWLSYTTKSNIWISRRQFEFDLHGYCFKPHSSE